MGSAFILAMILSFNAFHAIDSALGPRIYTPFGKPKLIYKDDQQKICIIGETGCDLGPLQNRFLQIINIERSAIFDVYESTQPANMLLIEPDKDLQNSAQLYAQKCLRRSTEPNGDLYCPPPDQSDFDGAVNVHVKTYDEAEFIDKIMDRVSHIISKWARTLKHYDVNKVRMFLQSYESGTKELHDCANVLRANTWKAGCGIVDFQITQTSFTEVAICYYKNNKLQDGDEIYTIGEPCSLCPEGSNCIGKIPGSYKSYANLCGVKPGSCPVTTNNFRVKDEHCYLSESKGNDVIFKCTSEENIGDCTAERVCSPYWEVDLNANFKNITVSGFCTSVNLFEKEIEIDRPACYKFQYIKESNGNPEFKSMVSAFVSQPNGDAKRTYTYEDVNEWTEIKLDIPWPITPFQVGVSVRSRSPPSAGQQVIKVREFTVTTGRCL